MVADSGSLTPYQSLWRTIGKHRWLQQSAWNLLPWNFISFGKVCSVLNLQNYFGSIPLETGNFSMGFWAKWNQTSSREWSLYLLVLHINTVLISQTRVLTSLIQNPTEQLAAQYSAWDNLHNITVDNTACLNTFDWHIFACHCVASQLLWWSLMLYVLSIHYNIGFLWSYKLKIEISASSV